MGKSSNYNYSHGRKLNKKEVYQLNGNISYNVDPKLNRWRKKDVLALSEEEISSINIQNAEGSFLITKVDSLWSVNNGLEERILTDNNSAFKAIKNDLKNLMASDFIDNDYEAQKDKVENPEVLVSVSDVNNNVINIKFSLLDGNKYIMQIDEQKDPLYIVYEHIVEHFQKKWEDFQ